MGPGVLEVVAGAFDLASATVTLQPYRRPLGLRLYTYASPPG